ncbi:MAG: membrane dipeptidase, partial [Myxococcales bacterium]|nr:membrane dipeptidase [Myxococcales bacterium]
MNKLITLTAIGALCAGMMMSTRADADQAPKKLPKAGASKLPKAGASKLPQNFPRPTPKLPQQKRSPLFDKDLNDGPQTLRGFVDLHTHPMSHLGFGGKLMHGAPDVGVLMPAGSIYNPAGVGVSGSTCNARDKRATSVEVALGSCYSSHAGHDLIKNKCGNHVRRVVIDEFENGKHTNKPHDVDHPPGFPSFTKWPKHDDIIHQQMWVDWIQRAHEGGLRVMVALTVNSMTLAKGLDGNQPYDDKTTGDKQLAEMKRMVSRHPWMEIAYSSADLRRIVGQDKLAIILGSEVDDIGNFAWSKREPTAGQVRAEIRRLHQLGVRYMFPVHVIDNHFGGTAMYEAEFPRASKYHFGHWPQIVCATASDGITNRFTHEWDAVITLVLGDAGHSFPVPTCPTGRGFKNARGLTPLGRVALDEMMALGMFIDIDHASQRTADDIIAYTGGKPGRYPVVSGHNGLRSDDRSNKHIHENTRTGAQYRAIAQRDGVAGVGFGDSTAPKFVANVRRVLAESPSIAINLGSDINGFVIMPKSDDCGVDGCVQYSESFPMARMGG